MKATSTIRHELAKLKKLQELAAAAEDDSWQRELYGVQCALWWVLGPDGASPAALFATSVKQ